MVKYSEIINILQINAICTTYTHTLTIPNQLGNSFGQKSLDKYRPS